MAAPEQVTVIEPIVAQVAPKAPVTGVEQIIREAARKYGISEDYLVKIAKCESSMNPNAVNYGYSENGKDFPSGLFQHLNNYWPARATKYGYHGASVFDAEANASVTAQMLKDGLSYLWECS